MKPYYVDDLVTIYHADCADLAYLGSGLWREPIDLLATDPPYGIGEAAGRNKSRSVLAVSRDYGDAAWDNEPVDLALLQRWVEVTRYAAIFGGNYYPLPPTSSWLVWDKCNGDNDFADVELCWTNYRIAARLRRHRWHGMLRKDREARFHPTQKPLEVMGWVISLCPGEVRCVVDPFCGSGTTLRAAKDRGIAAIGIEREERYCEMAAERMSQETLLVPRPGGR